MKRLEAQFKSMENKGELAPSESRRWTRIDDYLGAMARRRTARHKREASRRTQPEHPLALLSTVPFAALLAGLAVLAAAIMVAAWPGSQPQPTIAQVQHEQGVAPRGWLQEAEKQFH
jgi:hypothetical protein